MLMITLSKPLHIIISAFIYTDQEVCWILRTV